MISKRARYEGGKEDRTDVGHVDGEIDARAEQLVARLHADGVGIAPDERHPVDGGEPDGPQHVWSREREAVRDGHGVVSDEGVSGVEGVEGGVFGGGGDGVEGCVELEQEWVEEGSVGLLWVDGCEECGCLEFE